MAALTSLAIIGGGLIATGVGGKLIAAGKEADAARAAGLAQVDAARIAAESAREGRVLAQDLFNKALEERKRLEALAISLGEDVGKLTTGELATTTRLLADKERAITAGIAAIDRDQKILDSTDPVVKESGAQILQLLRGQDAATLAPLRRERERARQELESQLSRRLGTGYRTSSAGIEALTRFDEATAGILASAQTDALGKVTSTFTGAVASRPQISSEITQLGQYAAGVEATVGNIFSNQAQRRASSIVGGFTGSQQPVDFSLPFQGQQGVTNALTNAIKVAGAPYEGDLIAAQRVGDVFGDVANIGATIAGGAFGGFFSQNNVGSLFGTTKEAS